VSSSKLNDLQDRRLTSSVIENSESYLYLKLEEFKKQVKAESPDSVYDHISSTSFLDSSLYFFERVTDPALPSAAHDIEISLSEASRVTFVVLDKELKWQRLIFNQELPAGHYKWFFKPAWYKNVTIDNTSSNSSTIYNLLIIEGNQIRTEKLFVLE
jgi:hypothetical protein